MKKVNINWKSGDYFIKEYDSPKYVIDSPPMRTVIGKVISRRGDDADFFCTYIMYDSYYKSYIGCYKNLILVNSLNTVYKIKKSDIEHYINLIKL